MTEQLEFLEELIDPKKATLLEEELEKEKEIMTRNEPKQLSQTIYQEIPVNCWL